LLPHYATNLITGRTSYRPVEIKGRPSSYKKDDKRLHVDAFPATPVQGKRILRVFCNINPHQQPRVWHLGEPFSQVAAKFLPGITTPKPLQAKLLKLFKLTKSLRTPYDHYMLNIHDNMKKDIIYQQQVDKIRMDFPPSSTWITYTDITSHAALNGQYLLEQTFYLQPESMLDQNKSPLRILEKMTGSTLV
ncbi:MAG: Kdo hydroxylase family protein, partial [Gammaproteobacteria bacterium]